MLQLNDSQTLLVRSGQGFLVGRRPGQRFLGQNSATWKVSAATGENQFKGFGPCLNVTVLETAAPRGGSWHPSSARGWASLWHCARAKETQGSGSKMRHFLDDSGKLEEEAGRKTATCWCGAAGAG